MNDRLAAALEAGGARAGGRTRGGRLMRCAEALNRALHEAFEQRADVILIGEDVLDPYGGAFKITRGLSERWPDRVLTTDERGLAVRRRGLEWLIRGRRPILEASCSATSSRSASTRS